MFSVNDLFQWERFITPSIIKIFYWLAVAIAVLSGLAGIGSGFSLVTFDQASAVVLPWACRGTCRWMFPALEPLCL